ncbi:MAG: hypothetical protein LW834_07135 [Cyanobium sp. 49614_E6]|jgi:hypothetical protein|nr:hypothetical protein [Cyanobium sp. 49614_E6]
MSRQVNRHQFVYPEGVNNSEPRLGYRNMDDPATRAKVEAMVHPAARGLMTGNPGVAPPPQEHLLMMGNPGVAPPPREHLLMIGNPGAQPPADYRQFVDADDIDASRAVNPGVSAMDQMRAGLIGYDHGGPGGASGPSPITGRAQVVLDRDRARRERIAATPAYQRKGQAGLQGYASNPLEEEGRERIANQFWEAPLGGHVRRAAEGLGLEGDHARMAEQGLAGLTAVGIGVPAFLAAVQQLTTPADQNTIPFN